MATLIYVQRQNGDELKQAVIRIMNVIGTQETNDLAILELGPKINQLEIVIAVTGLPYTEAQKTEILEFLTLHGTPVYQVVPQPSDDVSHLAGQLVFPSYINPETKMLLVGSLDNILNPGSTAVKMSYDDLVRNGKE